MDDESHLNFMRLAAAQAREAADRGEVPVGAVIIDRTTGQMIAADGNRTRELCDPSAHAEMQVIRAACAHFQSQRIPQCDLYVTLEPCALCAAAISFARIGTVYYGADDAKGGGIAHGGKFYEQPTCHHRPAVQSGLLADEAAALLKSFFAARRGK